MQKSIALTYFQSSRATHTLNGRNPFDNLPVEILKEIFSWLPSQGLHRASHVCRAWRFAILRDFQGKVFKTFRQKCFVWAYQNGHNAALTLLVNSQAIDQEMIQEHFSRAVNGLDYQRVSFLVRTGRVLDQTIQQAFLKLIDFEYLIINPVQKLKSRNACLKILFSTNRIDQETIQECFQKLLNVKYSWDSNPTNITDTIDKLQKQIVQHTLDFMDPQSILSYINGLACNDFSQNMCWIFSWAVRKNRQNIAKEILDTSGPLSFDTFIWASKIAVHYNRWEILKRILIKQNRAEEALGQVFLLAIDTNRPILIRNMLREMQILDESICEGFKRSMVANRLSLAFILLQTKKVPTQEVKLFLEMENLGCQVQRCLEKYVSKRD